MGRLDKMFFSGVGALVQSSLARLAIESASVYCWKPAFYQQFLFGIYLVQILIYNTP
jgi:hypothetical protein